MAKKKHEYSHTTVHHHKDGSHTMKHHHESGDPKKDLEYAVQGHDEMMDGMQHNLSGEGGGEEAAEAGAGGGGGMVPGGAAV
jgi:hypothetical protein